MKKYVLIGITAISVVGIVYFGFNNESKNREGLKVVTDNSNIIEVGHNQHLIPNQGPFIIKNSGLKTISIGSMPAKSKDIDLKDKEKNNPNVKYENGIRYEKVRGYWLPPRPNPEENNKTLGGIDVNNNWVRDDLEHIYINKNESAKLTGELLQAARIYQKLMLAPPPNSVDFLMKHWALKTWTGEGYIFNTPERKKAQKMIDSMFGGGVYDSFMVDLDNKYLRMELRDFRIDGDMTDRHEKNMEGYNWDPSYYDDKPIIKYNKYGLAYGTYYKGKFTMVKGVKGCQLVGSKTESEEECRIMIKKAIKVMKENTPEEFIEKGLKNEIFNIN